jgi:hypothetical protein
MTPEERDALIAYVSEVERFTKQYALEFDALKGLLVKKALSLPMRLNRLSRRLRPGSRWQGRSIRDSRRSTNCGNGLKTRSRTALCPPHSDRGLAHQGAQGDGGGVGGIGGTAG